MKAGGWDTFIAGVVLAVILLVGAIASLTELERRSKFPAQPMNLQQQPQRPAPPPPPPPTPTPDKRGILTTGVVEVRIPVIDGVAAIEHICCDCSLTHHVRYWVVREGDRFYLSTRWERDEKLTRRRRFLRWGADWDRDRRGGFPEFQ